ncbi:MAG: ABC transporter permease [Eubacterium sp.]|nr:ABC transporter permease [Eubacterium sp.]
MTKKKILGGIIMLLLAVLLNFTIIQYVVPLDQEEMTLSVSVKAEEAANVQVYYLTADDDFEKGFQSSQVVGHGYKSAGEAEVMEFEIPADTTYIRFDPTETDGQVLELGEASLSYDGTAIDEKLSYDDPYDTQTVSAESDGDTWKVTSEGTDPFFIWQTDTGAQKAAVDAAPKTSRTVGRIIICVIVDAVLLFLWADSKRILEIPGDVLANKKLVWNLAKNDFKTKFAGSYLGIFWAFVQPIVTVFIYWFVFQKALRVGTQQTKAGITIPYVLWLIAGLIPWFYFQDLVSSGTNVFMEYNYLVKKVVFKISTLPFVKAISNLFVHLFFIGFMIVLYAVYRYYPDIYTVQIIYYSFAMIAMALGLVYATSAIVVFFKDLAQIVNIILQVLVWMTPIMWNMDGMGLTGPLVTILRINPMYYIVSGYRDSMINKVWFWERPGITLYFWILTILLFCFGTMVFRRLKVHFADVL